ncbi:MFS transporter [Paracoccus aminophilus]|nr:MFS transporter [Paracoccus aminophilus]
MQPSGMGLASGRPGSGRIRAIAPLMTSICLIVTANAMLTTSVSLYLSAPTLDPRVVQALLTAFPVGFLLGCLAAHRLVTALGHQRAFLAVALLSFLASCGYAMTQSFPVWLGLRLASGFATATLFVVSESWINLYADQRNRGAFFSLYMLMTSLAVLLGQLLISAAGPSSPHLFLIVIAICLAGVTHALFLGGPWPALPDQATDAPHPETRRGAAAKASRFTVWQLARLAPVTMVCVFQAGMTNMNVFTLTPIYGERIGLDTAAVVSLVTAFSIGGMLAQAPAGWISDRIDRTALLMVQGALTSGLCAAIIWWGAGSHPVLLGLFFAYGAVAMTIYPVGIAYANSLLDSRHMVAASGGLLLLYSFGNVLTPGIAAGLMDGIAPQALFVMLGCGAFLVCLTAAFGLSRRRARASLACSASKEN